ncbi:MAG: hypothetical protein V2A73_18170, partial [Pseudomonadota bacterium]
RNRGPDDVRRRDERFLVWLIPLLTGKSLPKFPRHARILQKNEGIPQDTPRFSYQAEYGDDIQLE